MSQHHGQHHQKPELAAGWEPAASEGDKMPGAAKGGTECAGRLWGCRKGRDAGRPISGQMTTGAGRVSCTLLGLREHS